jgi:translation initiation factor 1
MNICERCGLPKEACVCKELIKSEEKIKIRKEQRRYRKYVTMISGIDKESIKDIAKKLKTELACGGTVKDNVIELQGDHTRKTKEKLIEYGFKEENISE